MLNEAIILAGGFGSRLQKSVAGIPKPMAAIRNRPFLEYLLDFLKASSIERVILSTGYLSDIIEAHFGTEYAGLDLSYSVETKPLGTGGAVLKALHSVKGDYVIILNGDTLFKIDIAGFIKHFEEQEADISIALRMISSPERYGSVIINDESRITHFSEKEKKEGQQLINGGVYILRKKCLLNYNFPEEFSLEKDFFMKYCDDLLITGFTSDKYFIDIGTTEDYEKAQKEL